MGEAIAFYVTAALILGFAMLVVTTKNTVHRGVVPGVEFSGRSRSLRAVDGAIPRCHPGAVYAGGIGRALPVRRDCS
jgi:hypothetical protein